MPFVVDFQLLPDMGRMNGEWLWVGTRREGAALMYTLIETGKLNEVDHQAWLAGVLGRIADIPQTRISALLRWNWRTAVPAQTVA
jgi:hypothetical protein